VSVLYCAIPHFAAALARRDREELSSRPLILIGPEDRVFDLSPEVETCGVAVGMTARAAEVRCPGACLLEADVSHCRAEIEFLLQLLERFSSRVEAHGWGAAYVDLEDLRDRAKAVTLCQEVGRSVRKELGGALQPTVGWDSSKFTAQAAARRTPAGHLRAVDQAQEQEFLRPLSVTLLPLSGDVLRRLGFLGLRTLGQYGALSVAAVWQQFGRSGVVARLCARGEDGRPVIPRWQAAPLVAEMEFEVPLVERARLVAALRHLVSPLLAGLRGNLQACGQVRLTVRFDDGEVQEQERAFLFPVANEERVVEALAGLLDRVQWRPVPSDSVNADFGVGGRTGASGLTVVLDQIQDAPGEQLTLFPMEDEVTTKLREVQRYLATRFGSQVLRRAVLAQPGAPLPEWRVGWLDEEAA
jgi:nucleotidyltransferase/DNA polymerase involved in DNA repair